MTDLIARLEKLTGPDREVDAEIFAEITGNVRSQDYWRFTGLRTKGEADDVAFSAYCKYRALRYTASLDAALSLVPEGWEWELSWLAGVAAAKIGDPLLYLEGEAKTPAIALCIAALKARGIK